MPSCLGDKAVFQFRFIYMHIFSFSLLMPLVNSWSCDQMKNNQRKNKSLLCLGLPHQDCIFDSCSHIFPTNKTTSPILKFFVHRHHAPPFALKVPHMPSKGHAGHQMRTQSLHPFHTCRRLILARPPRLHPETAPGPSVLQLPDQSLLATDKFSWQRRPWLSPSCTCCGSACGCGYGCVEVRRTWECITISPVITYLCIILRACLTMSMSALCVGVTTVWYYVRRFELTM